MNFLKMFIVINCTFASCCFAESRLKIGTYKLEGSNCENGDINYRGKVIIKPSGELYELIWLIGSQQTQVGTAILEGDVLSVSYFDVNSKYFGVVSYHIVNENRLDGKWAGFLGTSYGREFLTYENEEIFN